MPNTLPRFSLLLLFIVSSFFTLNAIASDSNQLIEEKDFAKLSQQMKEGKKGLLLMLHSEGCPYCEALEGELLYPMVKSGDYKNVFIRKLGIDSGVPVIGFDGKKIDPDTLARSFGDDFILTPTIMFLDANGNEATEKLIGYNTPSLYGGYVEAQLSNMRKFILKNDKK